VRKLMTIPVPCVRNLSRRESYLSWVATISPNRHSVDQITVAVGRISIAVTVIWVIWIGPIPWRLSETIVEARPISSVSHAGNT
jgi:hypothetical protein